MARVTVVNDNPDLLELMRDILEDDRYETVTIDGDDPDALERIRRSDPDLLIIDLRLGTDELHGWRIAQEVRADPSLIALPTLVCSADRVALAELSHDLAEARNVGVLTKPFAIQELLSAIDRLLAESAPR